jgi:hypothetical protein
MILFFLLLLFFIFPVFSPAQLVLDSIQVVEHSRVRSIEQQGEMLSLFLTANNAAADSAFYSVLRVDSLGNLVDSQAILGFAPNDYNYTRLKAGSKYVHFGNFGRTNFLKVYVSTVDSVLGNLAFQATFSQPILFFGSRAIDSTELVFFGNVDSNYNQNGIRSYPFLIKYNPVTNQQRTIYFFERAGVPIPGARIYDIIRVMGNKRLISFEDGKPFLSLNGWRRSGFGDIAFFDADYNFLVDTVPLFSSWPGFPFDYTNPPNQMGPVLVGGLCELASGNIAFLGTVFTDAPVILDVDLMPAKWTPNLQKVSQSRFSLADTRELINQNLTMVQGWDGYLYGVTNYSGNRNTFEVLVVKLDTNMQVLDYTKIPSSDDLFLTDLKAYPSGVYFSYVLQTLGSTYVKSNVIRIRNSGVGVGVKRGEQLVAARVYPNPVQELLYWEAEQETQRFVWYDMQGRKLREEQLTAAQRQELDTETLAPGIYLLQAFAPDGRNFAPQRVVVR